MPTDAEWEGMKRDTMEWMLTPWVAKLTENDRLWLVKEKGEAMVLSPWIPPKAGGSFGQLFITKLQNNCFAGIEQWYVDDSGHGFDGKVLIRPRCSREELERRPSSDYPAMTKLWATMHYFRHRLATVEATLRDRGIYVPETRAPEMSEEFTIPVRTLDRR